MAKMGNITLGVNTSPEIKVLMGTRLQQCLARACRHNTYYDAQKWDTPWGCKFRQVEIIEDGQCASYHKRDDK